MKRIISAIDVCVVTLKNGCPAKGLEHIPIQNLIIERSKPLGLARRRAIRKVKTEWFAFVDDDVEIDKSWFSTITRCIEDDVGAIQGILLVKGLGEKWDRSLNNREKRIVELKKGERGFTHNTLIRTKCVKDWKPSRRDLSAFEDYEITQHILGKGYRWIRVPVESYHKQSWDKIKNNAIWATKGWKKLNPSRMLLGKSVIMRVGVITMLVVTFLFHPRTNFVGIFQQVSVLRGLLKW